MRSVPRHWQASRAKRCFRSLNISSIPRAQPAKRYSDDVPTDHWAYRYAAYAYANTIVSGYAPGVYGPDIILDRGQIAVFISRSVVTPADRPDLPSYTPPATPTFPDVPVDFWWYQYVEYIAAQGIGGGYPDGGYHPELPVTRDQMAVYITRAFRLPL